MLHRRIAHALLVATLGALTACGDRSPLSPLGSSSLSPSAATYAKAAVPKAEKEAKEAKETKEETACSPTPAAHASAIFGPAGGTLVFGTSRLIIPAGALQGPVMITGSMAGGTSRQVEFQPSGLQFSKAASLVLDTTGCSIDPGSTPYVVYVDASGMVIESVASVYDAARHTLTAAIQHFSGYAIAF